jgi:hypothetical protein
MRCDFDIFQANLGGEGADGFQVMFQRAEPLRYLEEYGELRPQ